MKIIFFNIWHGKVFDKLSEYLLEEAKTTDVFCLTEVDPQLNDRLKQLFNNYNSFYTKLIETQYLNGGVEGQSIFVNKSLSAERYSSHLVFDLKKDDVGALESIVVTNTLGKKVNIGSLHGMAKPGHKLDTPERISQSQKTIDVFRAKSPPTIIGGDFNLLPETKSVALFEEAGYNNLIKDFDIKTTRNRLSWDQFAGDPKNFGKQYYADYIFTSKDIEVLSFNVPNVEVSDHLPLVVNIKD